MSAMSWRDQSRYSCRVLWGLDGARLAGERGDVVIVVDVLSFSTTVNFAADLGLGVMPFETRAAAESAASSDPTMEWARRREAEGDWPSLAPSTIQEHAVDLLERGVKVLALGSPNGARASLEASRAGASAVLAGGLVNASGAALAAVRLARDTSAISVVACGEADALGWRPALEDHAGAGAIVLRLFAEMGLEPREGLGWASPEACAAAGLWSGISESISGHISGCASGLELKMRGFGEDVRAASTVDVVGSVARVDADGVYRSLRQ